MTPFLGRFSVTLLVAPSTDLFYDLLFARLPEQHRISLWCRQTKLSQHVRGREAFHAAIASFGACDVYAGLAARRPALGIRARGRISDCVGLSCRWLDVDRADDSQAHAAGNLPRTLDDLCRILSVEAVDPDLIVDSGHGWHVYWVFDTYRDFSAHGDSPAAVSAGSMRWQEPFIARARSLGWHLDQTGNLDRVLRIPGTQNFKTDPPAPVDVVFVDEKAVATVRAND